MTLMRVKLSFHGFRVYIFLCLLSGGARKSKKERNGFVGMCGRIEWMKNLCIGEWGFLLCLVVHSECQFIIKKIKIKIKKKKKKFKGQALFSWLQSLYFSLLTEWWCSNQRKREMGLWVCVGELNG